MKERAGLVGRSHWETRLCSLITIDFRDVVDKEARKRGSERRKARYLIQNGQEEEIAYTVLYGGPE